ncbi:MAG: Ion transport 2 domain protein [Gemmatimonadetes bacterium]|nr:Ion transport 2 domain protein [Gemmatimonadota bacterium]
MIRDTMLAIVGVLIVLFVLRDVLHELFHPEQTGSMSEAVTRGVWAVVRAAARHRRSMIFHAGPLILASVMAAWVILLVVGFALIYWPRLPGSFHADPALLPSETRGFLTAVYVSMASFTTLSAGDLTPRTPGMRILVALESFVGPVLFTAWITWVLGIYPVLAERRAFTRQIDGLRRARPDPALLLGDSPPEAVAELLRSLTEQALSVGAHLQQAAVSYYFQNQSEQVALAMQLPYLLALGGAAEAHGALPAIRHHGTMLRASLEQLLADMGERYVDLHDAPPEQVIDAIARDHLLPTPSVGGSAARQP